jgi:hypothetical protein
MCLVHHPAVWLKKGECIETQVPQDDFSAIFRASTCEQAWLEANECDRQPGTNGFSAYVARVAAQAAWNIESQDWQAHAIYRTDQLAVSPLQVPPAFMVQSDAEKTVQRSIPTSIFR